jgi:hypothetical protein
MGLGADLSVEGGIELASSAMAVDLFMAGPFLFLSPVQSQLRTGVRLT